MKQVFRQALVHVVAVAFLVTGARLAFAGAGVLGEKLAWGSVVTDPAPVEPVVARKQRTPAWREEMVMRAALAEDVHPAMLRAIMHVESKGKPQAVSKKGARGLMQVMPLNLGLCGEKGRNGKRLHDEEFGIKCGARVFSRFLRHYGENERRALWGYNGGHRGVKVIERCGVKNTACLGGYAVTVKYANDVLARLARERNV